MSNRKGDKLLNFTTQIDPMRTIGEIVGLLVAKGAQSTHTEYRNGEPVGLAFVIKVGEQSISFRLPCNADAVLQAMEKNRAIPTRFKNADQAKRTAWRIVKTWVDAQMAIVECEQAQMAEVFLPYAITTTGQTLFQRFTEDGSRLLGAGTPQEESESNVIEGRFVAST